MGAICIRELPASHPCRALSLPFIRADVTAKQFQKLRAWACALRSILEAVNASVWLVARDAQERLAACIRLIAKMPTLAAIAYKTSIGARAIHVSLA